MLLSSVFFCSCGGQSSPKLSESFCSPSTTRPGSSLFEVPEPGPSATYTRADAPHIAAIGAGACHQSCIFHPACQADLFLRPAAAAGHHIPARQHRDVHAMRHRGDSNPCGQSPMDLESISLATRTQCLANATLGMIRALWSSTWPPPRQAGALP